MDSACLEMEENVCLKLWVMLSCSPRYTRIVSEWQLDGQLAATDFFNTHAYAAQRAKNMSVFTGVYITIRLMEHYNAKFTPL